MPPVRLQFLADLKASVGNLAAMLESVTEMQRRYQELNVAVEQVGYYVTDFRYIYEAHSLELS